MKKFIIKTAVALTLVGGTVSCGNDYLETDYYQGLDVEAALNSVSNISTALNGTYYNAFYYYFAGNYATTIGDIPTDISYWNGLTGHWDGLYQFRFTDTDTYLRYIWQYGYRVADNTSRIIKAGNALYADATASEKADLDLYMAEAYALRAYAILSLVNVYGHQIKVNGTDFSSELGVVIVDEPYTYEDMVSRSTVGECYAAVLSDLNNALTRFTTAGGDRGNLHYIGRAATYGLLARTNLYMENWDAAKTNAQNALNVAGITTLTYTPAGYKALYNSETSNTESFFALAITTVNNWSANSCGTLWGTYNFSPSPKLLSMYASTDCRNSIMAFDAENPATSATPVYASGKFAHYSTGNSQLGTNYLVNAPEMFLIIAEAELNAAAFNATSVQTPLFVVARRDSAITSASSLPSTKADLLQFIKDERARELFQEGHRLWDLRRWDERIGVSAYDAPNINYSHTNYQISNLLLPVPSIEVNAGKGVVQTPNWSSTRPS